MEHVCALIAIHASTHARQIFDFYAAKHGDYVHERVMHYKDFWRFAGDFRLRDLFQLGTTDLVGRHSP